MTKTEETDKQLMKQEGKQLEITDKDGKTTIVFRQAVLKGKVSSVELLNTIFIAAKLQAEYYIKKLGAGSPLEVAEIKALKDLADISKLEVKEPDDKPVINSTTVDVVKSSLYAALAEKLEKK